MLDTRTKDVPATGEAITFTITTTVLAASDPIEQQLTYHPTSNSKLSFLSLDCLSFDENTDG